MKVAKLIKILQRMPKDAQAVASSDGEGKGFSPVADVDLG